jgi:hypothetical protein
MWDEEETIAELKKIIGGGLISLVENFHSPGSTCQAKAMVNVRTEMGVTALEVEGEWCNDRPAAFASLKRQLVDDGYADKDVVAPPLPPPFLTPVTAFELNRAEKQDEEWASYVYEADKFPAWDWPDGVDGQTAVAVLNECCVYLGTRRYIESRLVVAQKGPNPQTDVIEVPLALAYDDRSEFAAPRSTAWTRAAKVLRELTEHCEDNARRAHYEENN